MQHFVFIKHRLTHRSCLFLAFVSPAKNVEGAGVGVALAGQ